MKRITIEEAKKYISCNDDYLSEGIKNARYFTLETDDEGMGSCKVLYC
jgi:hypothetical protein